MNQKLKLQFVCDVTTWSSIETANVRAGSQRKHEISYDHWKRINSLKVLEFIYIICLYRWNGFYQRCSDIGGSGFNLLFVTEAVVKNIWETGQQFDARTQPQ